MTAAARAREFDEQARILLMERDPQVTFASCGLAYQLSGEVRSTADVERERRTFFQSVYGIEVWAVPTREGLLLDTGRAQGLEILMDGLPQPVLEGLTGVRRNIGLAPDALARPLAPPAVAAARN